MISLLSRAVLDLKRMGAFYAFKMVYVDRGGAADAKGY